jgi:ABC-type lipoprotein release transport system permease subunit
MRGYLSTFGVIAQIAFRNLFASRLKTVIVGGIIFFGALLVVAGTSFLDSIVTGMRRSIVGSVAGDIQVYSAESKDPLEVMGSFNPEGADLAALPDFAKVREAVMSVPGVKAVVPMGVSGAIVPSGNTIDVALARLRDLVRKKLAGHASPTDVAAYEASKGHVRQILTVLQGDIVKNARLVQDERALVPEEAEAVNRALEFLENRIAPQAVDADMLFLRYVGTDPAAFARSFERMKIVDGTTIPQGKRGFLFAKFTYEEQVKLKTARRLDKIKIGRDERGKTIATDAELQRFVKENSTQVRELLLQLDAPKTAMFRQKLQAKLGSSEADVAKLLSSFLHTDDGNFDDRYRFFYAELAPTLELYRVRIGDTLTIKAFTKSGYVQSVNLPVYGTFDFKGLEKSPQAGVLNIMDLVSFRDLYGFPSAEREQEIRELRASIRAAAQAKEVTRENAEAELFGSKATDEPAAAPPAAATRPAATAPAAPPPEPGAAPRRGRDAAADRGYDPGQLETGPVLNAAVILADERLAQSPRHVQRTIRAIEAAGKQAGLPLKAINWRDASGFIGQMVVTFTGVLYLAMLIIFLVALVIINNALVMATLQRVQEIGTLRAVGAQRRFILAMLVLEALVVGIVFGALGAGVGAIVVAAVRHVGIPSPNDISYFFFSGPRLHPFLAGSNLAIALVIVFVVSALSSLYPAWLAMRVSPRQAMQAEES